MLRSLSLPSSISIPLISRSFSSPSPSPSPPLLIPPFPSLPLRTHSKSQFRLRINTSTNDDDNTINNNVDQVQEPKEKDEKFGFNGNNGGSDDLGKDRGSPLSNINWVTLLLDPDPDNVIAVGLTGLLAWASVQVLWQLFFISLAILVAALKYSFIAALLIFILITLL